MGYKLARRYLDTHGAEGMPVMRFGRLLIVPVPKFLAWIGADPERQR